MDSLKNLDWARPEILVALLAFVAVLFVGASVLFLVSQRKKVLRDRLQASGGAPVPTAVLKPSRFMEFVEKVGNIVSHGQASTTLWEQLIQAGYLSKAAPAIYTGIKIVLFLLGMTTMALLVLPQETPAAKKMAMISVAGVMMFFVPNMIVLFEKRKRQQEVQHHLPDVVDLLEISVSSGVALDMAWNLVADEIDEVSPVLGTAMDLTNFEMHLGASRTNALRNMAMRTGAEQLSSLAAILVQSERFGTSMADALREFAASMREERRMKAEENAEKLAVKLIAPMVLFIFPAIITVMVGPAIVNIVQFVREMG